MRVEVDASFDTAPPLDLLLIPGGIGTRTEMKRPEMLDFLRENDCADKQPDYPGHHHSTSVRRFTEGLIRAELNGAVAERRVRFAGDPIEVDLTLTER